MIRSRINGCCEEQRQQVPKHSYIHGEKKIVEISVLRRVNPVFAKPRKVDTQRIEDFNSVASLSCH